MGPLSGAQACYRSLLLALSEELRAQRYVSVSLRLGGTVDPVHSQAFANIIY